MTSSKETSKISYTFSNGVEIKGTLEQIAKAASSFGEKVDFKKIDITSVPRGYYPSETKGLVKISEMNDYHIRRALLKRAKEYFGEIYHADDSNAQFLAKFMNLAEDAIVFDLFKEISSRK